MSVIAYVGHVKEAQLDAPLREVGIQSIGDHKKEKASLRQVELQDPGDRRFPSSTSLRVP